MDKALSTPDQEYEAADEAFRRAAALRPEASQVADALLRVEQTAQLDRILEHGARARAFEEQERWSDALEQYDAVLAIDDTVRFAVEGHRRAAVRTPRRGGSAPPKYPLEAASYAASSW